MYGGGKDDDLADVMLFAEFCQYLFIQYGSGAIGAGLVGDDEKRCMFFFLFIVYMIGYVTYDFAQALYGSFFFHVLKCMAPGLFYGDIGKCQRFRRHSDGVDIIFIFIPQIQIGFQTLQLFKGLLYNIFLTVLLYADEEMLQDIFRIG